MSFDYIRFYYQMPWLKRGIVVEIDGKRGVVTAGDQYVRVRFNGEKRSVRCHPQWEAVYYGEDGKIIADYRKTAASVEVK